MNEWIDDAKLIKHYETSKIKWEKKKEKEFKINIHQPEWAMVKTKNGF